MDAILQQLQSSTNPLSVLKQHEQVLSAAMQDGSDPLNVVVDHTLAVLYILCARLSTSSSPLPPPSWSFITQFCRTFDPEQARQAPEKVATLARLLGSYAGHCLNLKYAILPLFELATRYPPTPSTLTPIHTFLLITALQTGHIAPLVTYLTKNPIDDIDLSFGPELGYNDNLIYHYLAGTLLTLAALPMGAEPPPQGTPLPPPGQGQYAPYAPPPDMQLLGVALEYFEGCVTAPGQGPSPAAIQLEALKKMRIVQCLRYGAPQSLPKYAHPVLGRLFKSSAYHGLVTAFPSAGLRALVAKDQQLFENDRNWGLVLRLVGESESGRWQVKRLTESYVRLSLEEIGRALAWVNDSKGSDRNWEGEQRVRALILGMIESGMINASIDARSLVTFHDEDPEDAFGDLNITDVLASVQEQSVTLQGLDQEISRSRDFLTRVVKGGSSAGGGNSGSPFGIGGVGMPGMMGGVEDEDMVFGEEGVYA
ncbi:hypothetical protein VNI00_011955 [Paramarasmius palmivorus]|uniref:COP9 signalosome complex subunit 3 N-terminal helical repeats domain-containing protein n=1 Tax=Paramarasmius palmivorus TaxID=297713 RepID=A0AAW0CAG0_9AGAR